MQLRVALLQLWRRFAARLWRSASRGPWSITAHRNCAAGGACRPAGFRTAGVQITRQSGRCRRWVAHPSAASPWPYCSACAEGAAHPADMRRATQRASTRPGGDPPGRLEGAMRHRVGLGHHVVLVNHHQRQGHAGEQGLERSRGALADGLAVAQIWLCVSSSALEARAAPGSAWPRRRVRAGAAALHRPGRPWASPCAACNWNRGVDEGRWCMAGVGAAGGSAHRQAARTSKVSVAFGGMTPPAPLVVGDGRRAGRRACRRASCVRPSVQQGMTRLSAKSIGWSRL